MSLILGNAFLLYLTFFGIGFLLCYLNFEKIEEFFTNHTFKTQEEILEIMDKLLISQNKKKFKKSSWMVSCLLSLLGFFLMWPSLVMSLIVSLVIFFGVWAMFKRVMMSLWVKHCNRVVEDLVEALTIMCNSIKVGLSLGQSIERVIKGYPGALGKEFQLVLNEMELGLSLEESLEEMAERIQKPEVDMLVSTTNILKETGGNLGETFFVMSETIRERQKMEKKIKALTAAGMTQAKIISVLPFGLIGVFAIMDRNYISPLFTNPLGWLCLFIVLTLVIVGWLSMKKIVAIKV